MNPYRSNKNAGAALVVSLIILLVVTLLGVAGITGSGMQLKLTSITKGHAQAFEAAEATLKIVEQEYVNTPPKIKSFYSSCADGGATDCGTVTCNAGLCFKGAFDGSDPEVCDALKSTDSTYTDFWSDNSFWDDAAKYATKTHTYYGTTTGPVKYIVEFLCLGPKEVKKEIAMPSNTQAVNNNLATVLRITVHATDPSGRSVVNLQSVIKVPKL